MNIIVNFRHVAKRAFEWTLRIYSIVGILCFFVNIQDLLDENWCITKKIIISGLIFIILFLVIFIVTAFIYGLFIQKIKKIKTGKKNSVYLCYGDVFRLLKRKKRNIVISVNRCFDTIVDNQLISETSLHGQLFKKLYKSDYNEQNLNAEIQNTLLQKSCKYKQLTTSDKPNGNLKRFSLGTVVELKNDSVTYFLMGLSSLDKDLAAHTSLDEYIFSINKLIDYCYIHSQGFPVIIPLIGGGLSRIGIDEQDLLQLLLDLLRVNKSKIISDFYIVVNGNISITN